MCGGVERGTYRDEDAIPKHSKQEALRRWNYAKRHRGLYHKDIYKLSIKCENLYKKACLGTSVKEREQRKTEYSRRLSLLTWKWEGGVVACLALKKNVTVTQNQAANGIFFQRIKKNMDFKRKRKQNHRDSSVGCMNGLLCSELSILEAFSFGKY